MTQHVDHFALSLIRRHDGSRRRIEGDSALGNEEILFTIDAVRIDDVGHLRRNKENIRPLTKEELDPAGMRSIVNALFAEEEAAYGKALRVS